MAFLWLMNGGLLLSTCLSLKTTYLYAYTRNQDVGVSKNRGTPKRFVKIMENPVNMDDLGGCFPPFLETSMFLMPFVASDFRKVILRCTDLPSEEISFLGFFGKELRSDRYRQYRVSYHLYLEA